MQHTSTANTALLVRYSAHVRAQRTRSTRKCAVAVLV
jgi:hypothetical protein